MILYYYLVRSNLGIGTMQISSSFEVSIGPLLNSAARAAISTLKSPQSICQEIVFKELVPRGTHPHPQGSRP